MITGLVKANEGRIRLKIKGPRGREQEIDAVIDTGYNASLTLSPSVIAALGLRWQSLEHALLLTEAIACLTRTRQSWYGMARPAALSLTKPTPTRLSEWGSCGVTS